LRVERMACIIGGGIGDCFLHLGWIATWSEPGPALVIGAGRSHSPFGQSLSCWGVHTLEHEGADRPDLVNNGPYQLLVASPGLWCLPDGNACQCLGGTHERVPIQND
jgi:hypothetical protein